MNKNSQYIILLSNVRDRNQVKILAHQIFADSANLFMKNIYDKTLQDKYSYIVLNLHPRTKDVSIHRGILPNDTETVDIFKI